MKSGNKFGTVKLNSKERDNLFLHFEYDKRNRSLSSIIRIPKEFVPKPKPKPPLFCPSPMLLNHSKNNLPKAKKVKQMTKENELAISFDEDDLNEKENNTSTSSKPEKSQNEDNINDMRCIMNRIRSNTVITTKDDYSLLNSKQLLKEYGNIATGDWICNINKRKDKFELQHKKSFCYWSMQKERAASILGFLEFTAKEKVSCL